MCCQHKQDTAEQNRHSVPNSNMEEIRCPGKLSDNHVRNGCPAVGNKKNGGKYPGSVLPGYIAKYRPHAARKGDSPRDARAYSRQQEKRYGAQFQRSDDASHAQSKRDHPHTLCANRFHAPCKRSTDRIRRHHTGKNGSRDKSVLRVQLFRRHGGAERQIKTANVHVPTKVAQAAGRKGRMESGIRICGFRERKPP